MTLPTSDTGSRQAMTPGEFARKWRGVTTGERASAQAHFLDLCRLLGEPAPHDVDPSGEWFAFEKGAEKLGGGEGFADVWKRGFFAWEYKGKGRDLRAAYRQLVDYKDALENPPLLVVSDMERIEVRTNFTGLAPATRTVTLDELGGPDPATALAILRAVFTAPEELKPADHPAELTEEAARHFAELAWALRGRSHDPERVAHFLDRLLFCLFAEDARILPKGVLSRLAESTRTRPELFTQALRQLFDRMSHGGGMFGAEEVPWFNGGLFDSDEALDLTSDEIATLMSVGRLDWALIEPAIFGTLFERGLDPDRRAQLGAHYTAREQIWQLVEPVVIRPLRREYAAMQAQVTELLLSGRKATRATPAGRDPVRVFEAFLDRLRHVRVLDPACGSGNFLYVTLKALKDLEWEAIQWGSLVLHRTQIPQIGPEAVLGIEVNAYAAELARVTIWIGQIQWMLAHGLGHDTPVLRPLHHIENRDALLDLTDPTNPREAEWPAAEFIVGNPPFLGSRLLRRGLGSDYVDALFEVYDGKVTREGDLVTYWHEKARAAIASRKTRRAGLLATQGIRGRANRRVLERIKETGEIFFARSDDPWVLSGAAVHISFVGQDDGSETSRTLNGLSVPSINANLTTGFDLSKARQLRENLGIAFMGDTKGGPFDIDSETARRLIAAPNPDGRSNTDVVLPWLNGADITGRPTNSWIVDFGAGTPQTEAALYEAPFEHIVRVVKPIRVRNRRQLRAERWWIHAEAATNMRRGLARLDRYIATPITAKHRLFVWVSGDTLPDHQLIVFGRDDDYMLGVLHSRVHELWARATGTQLREVESGFRYTPTTCFETFPLPRPTDAQREAIGAAAARLHELREGWLNPSDQPDAELAKRTLTNLYNQRPTWLANAHATLDTAVLDAYGWPADLPDDQILERLLALNLERAAAESAS